MAGWGSAWDQERAAQCELQSVGFCKHKSESRENSDRLVSRGERGQIYFLSVCVSPGLYQVSFPRSIVCWLPASRGWNL